MLLKSFYLYFLEAFNALRDVTIDRVDHIDQIRWQLMLLRCARHALTGFNQIGNCHVISYTFYNERLKSDIEMGL